MSINLKCAACGQQVLFKDDEAICPSCEVLLRRHSEETDMAIPVSMALPKEFEPVDLSQLLKLSQKAAPRYQKNISDAKSSSKNTVVTPMTPQSSESDQRALAQAIDRLASALETNAGVHPSVIEKDVLQNTVRSVITTVGSNLPEKNRSNLDNEGTNNEEATALKEVDAPEVTILNERDYKSGKTTAVNEQGKALPVEQALLVRSEAATEAALFQRKNRASTDTTGRKKNSLAVWADSHPVFMFFSGLILLIGLVFMIITLLDDTRAKTTEETESQLLIGKEAALDSPDFFHAEREARGFLNAIALKSAKPYIFRAHAIGPKLDKFYRPLPNPADYELTLTHREQNNDKNVYYYTVESDGRKQPLVVLQQQHIFRVFWEYGAGIGDISWPAFLGGQPTTPVLLRAFLQPSNLYDNFHSQDEWSSWIAQDWEGSHTAVVYAKINSLTDRRLKSAWQKHAIKRGQGKWITAQIRLKHLNTSVQGLAGQLAIAEAVEVPLGSWLPEEFVDKNTFYSENDQNGTK